MTGRVLIVGSGGQDGTLLREILAASGDTYLGIRRNSTESNGHDQLPAVDILDPVAVQGLVSCFQPEEVYFLAAAHHSSQDEVPDTTELTRRSYETHVFALVHFLEAIRKEGRGTRLLYASSSLVFGPMAEASQALSETTPLCPSTPYGLSKTAGMLTCRAYRKEHGVFASNGILFNHESFLRSDRFVTKKIVKAAVAIQNGRNEPLYLGNLDAQVDWTDARDTLQGMIRVLRHVQPDDFVIASGKLHSVRDFAKVAFAELGLNYELWVRQKNAIVTRRNGPLRGNASKLRKATGWKPEIPFREMIRDMLAHEGGRLLPQ